MPSAIAQEKLAARAHRIRLLRQRIVASVLARRVDFDHDAGDDLVDDSRRLGRADHEPVVSEHAFWITSRAAGIIALLAASLADRRPPLPRELACPVQPLRREQRARTG